MNLQNNYLQNIKRKVAIVGAGFVGASIAYALSVRNISREIVLIDTNYEKSIGEAMDIQHGIPYMGNNRVYAGGYSDCSDCRLIIICAGRGRKSGETRLDLAESNIGIVSNVIENLKRYYSGCPVIIVSNPNDILTLVADKELGMPNGVVFGTGCLLDSSRFVSCIAEYLSIDIDVLQGFVIGEHGDNQIPVWSRLSVAGEPIDEYCKNMGIAWNEDIQDGISKKVLKMGAEIISRKEKTHYGIATCVCYLADVVLNKRQSIASVSSPLQGEYGISGVSISVPSVLGVNGVEKHLVENLTHTEIKRLQDSANKLRIFFNSFN